MSPISMDCFRCYCAVLMFAASSRPAVVPAEDPARSLQRDARGAPPSPSATAADEPAWSVISDGLLADLESEGKKPDWPGKTTGVAADRTTGEVFVLVPGQGVWRTAEGGVRFERVDGGKVGGRCETGWSVHTDPEGKRMACFMLDGPSALTLDGGKTWSALAGMGRGWDYGAVDWTAAEPRIIFALRHESGGERYLSADLGRTWKKLGADPKIEGLGVAGAEWLLLHRGAGIERSADGGATWTKVSDLKPWSRVAVLFRGAAYWVGEAGLIVSKDEGKTWQVQGSAVDAVQGPFFGKDESHMVVVGKKGFSATTDGGKTWKHAAPLPDPGCRVDWFGNCAWDPLADVFYFATMGQPAWKRGAGQSPVPAKGHAFLQEDFNSGGAPGLWHGLLALDAGFGGGRSLRVERTAGQAEASMVFADLPAEAMRGCTVRGMARVRAEGVSAKPNPWNGIKCMLAVETPERKLWPQAPIETGTFDWRQVGFTARIPADCTAARLCLALEEVAGKAWFDDVKVTLVRPPRAKRAAPSGKPIPKAHDLPRLRGAMVGPRIDEDGLRKLGLEWNANLVRWQLIRHAPPGQPAPLDDYDRWLDGELERLDAALVRCERYGLLVVVDLHSPPGGRSTVSGYVGSDDRLFSDRSVQDKFVEVWRRMARRYKDARAVWGYDLANEPVEEYVGDGCDDWHDLAERAARAVREVDARHAIIVEAPPWGSPESLADFEPLSVPGVVYSAHMYVPAAFTHQGVFRQTQRAYSYPGEIEGKRWDKAALEAALRPVLEFQQAYSVPIYIGEFSAIRWAPDDSACRYLRDAIEIFESHGWDWSYHAFREWDGWSVEHGEDRTRSEPSPVPTTRERLLREWFAQSEKPSWWLRREPEAMDGAIK